MYAEPMTITTILKPDSEGILHLTVPDAWRKQPIRVKAELEPLQDNPANQNETVLTPLKGFGCLRGKIRMMPGFDDPLEDFKDYML